MKLIQCTFFILTVLFSLSSYGFESLMCKSFLMGSFHEKNQSLASNISASELSEYAEESLKKVPEFKYIKEQAEQLGLRVWLFGGTASSFIHYTKWDLLRKKGLLNLQADRFDFDFTNIFRSTQDLDIVVDADPDVAKKFEVLLKGKFPHFLGNKSNKWEVRTLLHTMGEPGVLGFKEALLHDKDFSDQNTDTNSIGMVEITDSNNPRISDLKSWEKEQSIFLEDVLNNQISYFRSDQHFETIRARNGENPEILSVLRLLVKSFQYGLSFSEKTFAVLKEISESFDPKEVNNLTAQRKIAETAKKLVMHSVNIEATMSILESLGLREKLISMGQKNIKDDFAWWLNREPLRSHEVGQGESRTARELGIEIVAHETNTFLSYESITRSHGGEPNVLISRREESGENAVYGDGFYTRLGKIGARGTGLTVRFTVDPNAREGTDFIKVFGDYVVFLNKKALKVIPESLNFDLDSLIELAENDSEIKIDHADRALIEKLKRRLNPSVLSDEFEKLLYSDKEEDQERLLRIAEALQNRKLSKLIPDELNEYVERSISERFTLLLESGKEEDIEKYLKTAEPLLKIFNGSEFYDGLLQILSQGFDFEMRKKILFKLFLTSTFSLNLSNHKKIGFARFFTDEELKLIQEEIKSWGFSEDTRKAWFFSSFNNTDLTYAVSSKQRLIFILNEKVIDINYRNVSDLSLLQIAAHNGKKEVVDWIVRQKEFDFSMKNSLGFNEVEQLRLAGYTDLADEIESLRPDAKGRKFEAIERDKNKVTEEYPEGAPIIDFIEFQAGSFLMGSGNKEVITLTQSFELLSVDVTQKMYKKVVELIHAHLEKKGFEGLDPDPSAFKGSNLPVEQVSHDDVTLWIKGLNELRLLNKEEVDQQLKDLFPGHDQSKIYDLPTSAQWEYAARLGGASMKYAFGSSGDHVNEYTVNGRNSNGKTNSVGSKKPVLYNGKPLYDLFGNVLKWVRDWYTYDYDFERSQKDPLGPESGTEREIRGSTDWGANFDVNYIHPGDLSHLEPNSKSSTIGFRVMRFQR